MKNRTKTAFARAGDVGTGSVLLVTSKPFLSIYAFSFFVNLIVGAVFRFRSSFYQLEADEREYYEMARAILARTLAITPRRSLGFPALEAAIQCFTSNFIVLQLCIVAIYSFSPPLLFKLIMKLCGDARAAVLGALALAVWPPALYFGVSLYSESVALPLVLLTLLLLPAGRNVRGSAWSSRDWQAALLAGLCLALATQVRPMYLLFLPVIMLIMVLEQFEIVATLRRFAIVLVGFALLTAPWSYYLSTRYHHVILVTSNGGETLAGGLTPKLLIPQSEHTIQLADRTTWVGPGKWLTLDKNGYLSDADLLLPYDRLDALLKARTMNWVEHNPGDAAFIEASKLRYLWGFSSMAQSDAREIIFGALPTIFLLCASIAFWVAIPGVRKRYPRLWLLPLFVSGVALISWGSWRFRQVGDVGLLALCAISLVYLKDTWRIERAKFPQRAKNGAL